MKLELGDVVQIISGGPNMTVGFIPDCGGLIHCFWFNDKELCQAKLRPEALIETEKKT